MGFVPINDVVYLIVQFLAYGILFYVIYVVIRELVRGVRGVPSSITNVHVIPVNNSFCGVKEKHVHYRVYTVISGRRKRYGIVYYYCPVTNKVQLSDVGPVNEVRAEVVENE